MTRQNKILFLILVFSSSYTLSQDVNTNPLELQKLLNYNEGQIKKRGEYLLNTRTRQIWNQNLQSWDNDSLFEYTYNSQALVDTITANTWRYGGSWGKYSRWIYIYNSSNQVIEVDLYFWHSTTWDIYARNIYTYIGSNLWRNLLQFRNGSTWSDVIRATYNWNSNNQITMLISEVPNTYFPGWCNFWKTEHLYDSTSRLEKMIEFDGDCSSIWKLERQNLFTYDGRGNKIDDIRQLWIDSIWINDSQYKYEYDSSNVLIRTVFLDWQPDSLKWENVWRESYTQNISSNLVRTLTEIWYNQTEWQNSKNRIIGYDDNENWIQDATQNWDSIQWVNQFRYLATWYEPVSVDDNINSVNNFSLSQNYPNPFNPTTIINYQLSEHSFVTIKVYDVLGKEIVALVNEQKPAGNYEIQLDGNGLTSGIYFYQLKAGSFVETKKMVLIK